MPKQSIYHEREYAEEYDQERFGGSFGRYLQEQEVELFLSLIGASDKRVLDVGAGTGKFSLPLLRQSRQVVSLDSSWEMLTVAKKKAEAAGVELVPVVCDAHRLCFQDGVFDCVVSSRTLMHLADWRRGLSELCRVAQEVVVDFPPVRSFSGPDSFFKRCKSFFVKRTRTYKTFLIGSVIKELQRQDLHVVVLRKQFFLPMAFHRWLNKPGISMRIEKWCKMLGLVWLLGAPVTVKAMKIVSK